MGRRHGGKSARPGPRRKRGAGARRDAGPLASQMAGKRRPKAPPNTPGAPGRAGLGRTRAGTPFVLPSLATRASHLGNPESVSIKGVHLGNSSL